jgi:hypothetical protein
MTTNYIACTVDDIPAGLRWDVPKRNQGQIVEIAYAAPRSYATESGPGDEYRRTTDTSCGVDDPARVRYERRSDVAPVKWAALSASRTSLDIFDDRTTAERRSISLHGHDCVLQMVGGSGRPYRDAKGDEWTREQAIAALVDASPR